MKNSKTITELLHLYEEFFIKLSDKLNTDKDNPIVSSEKFENPADEEIDALEGKFKTKIPEDIRTFWKTLKHVYEAVNYDEVEWGAGRDFIPLKYIVRDTPNLRKLADNYEDDDPLKKLHQTGIQLTFSEPILLFDGATKTGNIHWLCWDGEPLADVIAPDITAFFEHWLAAGCFYQGDFKAYWEVVKDIVPIHIAEDKNLWLNFYNKQYKPVDEDAEKAQEAMAAASNAAYQQGREGIELWRSGEEEEAVKLFAKAIDFGLKNDDEHPVTQTICNHAYLCSEADRQEEGFQVMRNFYNDNKSFAENAPGVLSLLGQYYYENNNLDEAYKLCLSAVEKAPMFGLGYYRMACLYIRLNKLDDALSNVIKAAKCDKSLCEDLAADTDFEKIKDRLEFKKAVGIAT